MTGKQRKEFIVKVSKLHAEQRARYAASGRGSYEKISSFGYMLGIEMTVHYAGMGTLCSDLVFLREKECPI